MMLRLYAFLLRCYPRVFYTRFAAEMLDVFAHVSANRAQGRLSALRFWFHEFGGLLFSIAIEHGRAQTPWRLFRRRLVPVWLFVFSLTLAVIFSLSYWGYLVVPSSTFSTVHTIDQIALVRFDSDYTLTPVPLNDLPHVVMPDFPPSQILTQIDQRQANLAIEKMIDPALAASLTAALAQERVEIAAPRQEYPREPMINPNDCGENCFSLGVQPQTDGSLLVVYPEYTLAGQPSGSSVTQRVTVNDWWYYGFILPAGYVVQGRDADGTPVIFVALASGAVANDRYRYHELIFTPGADGLTLRSRMSYNFDVAGLEGFNVPIITTFLFVPLLFLWLLIVVVGGVIALVVRQTAGRRGPSAG